MMNIPIKTQPDDVTCGPTSLHAVYRFYADYIPLDQLVRETEYVNSGGTIAALLGKHALVRGYDVSLYVYNLSLFDPTWFDKNTADPEFLIQKLKEQEKYKTSPRFLETSYAFRDYLQLGGRVIFKDLNVGILQNYFKKNIPIITALSATYLYESKREATVNNQTVYDDIKGEPCGHFVVLCGYDEERRHVVVADPHRENPLSHDNYYKVDINRLLSAILLGIITYDANLLIIEPKGRKHANNSSNRQA